MKIQAKTVVLELTVRRPNTQVSPSRGRRTTDAKRRDLCVQQGGNMKVRKFDLTWKHINYTHINYTMYIYEKIYI